jgi:hypothetical protein
VSEIHYPVRFYTVFSKFVGLQKNKAPVFGAYKVDRALKSKVC